MPHLLQVKDLRVHFPVRRGLVFQRQVGAVKAVDGVSFSIKAGETLGLVGESGSGKTTIGKAIVRLVKTTSGSIRFDGQEITQLNGADLRAVRRRMGIVFQDPYGALNPRLTAGSIVGEPLIVHKLTSGKGEFLDNVAGLIETVGLNPAMMNRYPHEFSGGQRQRLGVARALAARPSLIILDEPVSALDVSIQAQVINLLQDLQERFKLAYLFIAHDLSVVRHISDRVSVMYLGKMVEIAESSRIYDNPLHPYTQALLSAVPVPDPIIERQRTRIVLRGDIPSPLSPPPGCVFHTRCPIAIEDCPLAVPEMRELEPGHTVACIRAGTAV
ncbi:MAG: ATP-binding cassette domain-containing protein [Chloroflexi bacterium]|nr:ATP-binding cassette domain-containing protein [Chloroflexota bacterium]